MDKETLLAIFTGVLAFAVLVQSFLFFGIYRSVRRMTVWMDSMSKDLLRDISAISSKTEECLITIKGIADNLKPITDRLASTTEIVHRRVVDLDAFLSEATNTARLEILRVQDTIQGATRRADETVEILQNTILAPIQEINAITRGIRAGLNMLFRGRRSISNASAQDEEMFI